MAAKKHAKKTAKKRSKKKAHHAKKAHKGGKKRSAKKMPLIVLEHLAAGAVNAVEKRHGTVRRHTKAELKKARK